MRAWVTGSLAVLLLVPVELSGAAFDIQGSNLTVTTDTLKVSFRGADVTGVINLLTGESYLRPTFSNPLLNLLFAQGSSSPLNAGNWSVNPPGTAATLTATDSTRTVFATVTVDSKTQEVVVNLAGLSKSPGVQNLNWGISGFDLSAGKFVLPAADGGVTVTSTSLAKHSSYRAANYYPASGWHWEAPLSLFQGARGGAAVYSTDTQSLYKEMTISGNPQTANAVFAVQAPGPFRNAVAAGPIEWRLAAYQGDWQAGARIYRDWHSTAMPTLPLEGKRAWAAKIRAVVRLQFRPYSAAQAESLAKVVNPSQTLLFLPDWRAGGFNAKFPDYTPDAGAKPLIDRAHQLGFHVMIQIEMPAVTPDATEYAAMRQFQARDPLTLELMGWDWNLPVGSPSRWAYINPAASAYRSLLIDRIRSSVQSLQPDGLYMDTSGFPINDGNGLIEGMNYLQGTLQLHKDMLAAFPGQVFGGEGMSDVLAPMQSFWVGGHAHRPPDFNSNDTPSVPITQYVLPAAIPLWSVEAANPNAPGFLADVQPSEGQALLPSYWEAMFLGHEVPDYSNPDMVRYMNVVSAFQQNDLQPDWDANWNGAAVRYKGANGASATLTDSGTLVQFSLQSPAGAKTIYQRVRNVNQVVSTASVLNWPAYSGTLTMGLDPDQCYWLDATPPNTSLVHITNLPSGVKLGTGKENLATPDFAYFRLLPAGMTAAGPPTTDFTVAVPPSVTAASIAVPGGTVKVANGSASISGFPLGGTAVVFAAAPRLVALGQSLLDIPFTKSLSQNGQFVYQSPVNNAATIGPTTASGVTKPKTVYAFSTGDLGSMVSILSWPVQLPNSAPLFLSFSTGFWDSATPLAPVTFAVRVNGAVLWQFTSPYPAAWQPGTVDLSPWAGKSVVIELVSDSAGLNYFQFSSWAELTVDAASNACATSLIPGTVIAVPYSGAFGTVRITTSSGCFWSAVSAADWVTVNLSSGTGTGAVSYTIQANPGAARQTTLAVGGHLLTISQDAAPPCTYSISPTAQAFSANGGLGTVTVTAGALCGWTATSADSWVTIRTGVSGTGAGSVFYSIAPNPDAAGRTGAMTIAGQTFTIVQASGSLPAISQNGVVNAASLQPGIAAGAWITIRGTKLSAATRTWGDSDFIDGRLPTQLEGVSVNVNGKPAYVYFISPAQLNVLAPGDGTVGPVAVEVVTPQGKSSSVTVLKQAFAPAFFLFDAGGRQYIAATHSNGTLVGKPDLFDGAVAAEPARPGETILLFATGLGPTDPPAAEGLAGQSGKSANSVTLQIGGVPARVEYAGLVGPGLYQLNVTLPQALVGDQAVVAEIAGFRTQTSAMITIQNQ